jgi:hypothetical protein
VTFIYTIYFTRRNYYGGGLTFISYWGVPWLAEIRSYTDSEIQIQITRLTRRVPLVEQELPTLPEHMSSPLVFSGVRVTRSLVLYVCFVDRCLSFCTFFFWPLCCLFFFDIRFIWLPLWYLQTLLTSALLIGTLLQNNGKKVEVISFVGQFRSTSVVIPSFRARHQYRYVGYRTRKMFVVWLERPLVKVVTRARVRFQKPGSGSKKPGRNSYFLYYIFIKALILITFEHNA